jgi:nucleosome assembly protein 1-like 1
MPRPKTQQPESESEDDHDDDGRAVDFARFTNPNYSREFLATLPQKVRDRTKVLMSWDDKRVKECNEREIAMDELRRKYEGLFAPLFARRKEIVTGTALPTQEEVLAGFPAEHKDLVEIDGEDKDDKDKGIPTFWLDALQHHVIINDMITERDQEILEHLIDISVATLDPKVRPGFTVMFTFEPNEYFTETSVFKTFYWKHECGDLTIDTCDQGPITWNEGKDPTVTTVTQKQKSKSKKGAVRYITKTEPCESFFNLFKPSEDAEENEQWCSLAMTIREKVAPLAVEYFTGEAADGSSDLDEDEAEEDEDDEEEEEEEEEMPMPRGGRGRGGSMGGRGGPQAPAPARGKDCKQQ